jgi:catechol 2,3-dioxygenase-like lactoylglutathione lyase family enzyme
MFIMRMNHLALPACDIAAQQRFYVRYFGFQPSRGDGFLTNSDGFVLVLDPVLKKAPPAEGLHHGFLSSSHAEVRALHDTMLRDGVTITHPPEAQGPMLTFFCQDPEGYAVEVRGLEP